MAAVNCQTRTQRGSGVLGLILLLRNSAAWHAGAEPERRGWDLHDTDARARLERLLSGRVFQAYGARRDLLPDWPFFSLLEFSDLEAWGDLHRSLEAWPGREWVEWEVVFFGRRAA